MLSLQGVTKQFGGLAAINNVDLKVEKDLIFGIIGPNGAGKTTLFNLITGLVQPTEGVISFQGYDITDFPSYKINRMGIARTFQNIRLFPGMTVLENILAGQLRRRLNLTDRRPLCKPEELLELLGLTAYRHAFAGELPYGHQRRLEIARALATGPELLLLDEPAAGMNETETAGLIGDIRAIKERGCTVIVIEHDMSLVMSLSDRVAVLNFGEKIAEGSAGEIRENPAVVEAYLGEEARLENVNHP